jgi:hypothetical protein
MGERSVGRLHLLLLLQSPACEWMVTPSAKQLISYFHETYHVGQTEMLRQLAGKNDQVI